MNRSALNALFSLFVACAGPGEDPEVGTSAGAVSVSWTNVVGVTATGNDLTKTSGVSAWNAGAVSVETLAGDGYVEFTTAEATTAKTAGLSSGDSGQGHADIDFAIRLRGNGSVGVYEGGVLRGTFGTYAPGYLFRVEVKGGVVSYKKNGVTFYTSAVAPTFPLLVDTSLYTPGGTIDDVNLVATAVTWQNLIGVTATGNDLIKTSTTPTWRAGASTVQTLTGDGFAEFVAGEATTAKAAGLSIGDFSTHWTNINFAIRLGANGTVSVFEYDELRGSFGTYVAGDRFRIEVSGGVVRYSRNGARPFYTSSLAPTFPLLFDTSFLTPGGTINDVTLVDAVNACPAYDGGGPVCAGSFTVNDPVELAAIAGCASITGDLTIQAPGMTEIALPTLERVGGALTVVDSPDLRWLRLPELKQVENLDARLTLTPAALDLSRLRIASQFQTQMDGFEVSAPCLESTTTFRAETSTAEWAAAHVPRLRAVSDLIFGKMTAPALETAGAVDANLTAPVLESVAGPVSGALRAPVLVTVGGDVAARPMDAPSLTAIGGTLGYYAAQNLPALERAGGITFLNTPEVDLPALVEVTGAVRGACTGVTPAATVVDLPSLRRAGSVELCWNGLQQVFLPQLDVITGQGPGPSLRIRSIGLIVVEFPALESIDAGTVTMEVSSSFPLLSGIGDRLEVLAPMTAPVLTAVGDTLLLRSTLTAQELQEVGDDVLVQSALSAPALTTVGGDLVVSASLTAPSLLQVDGGVEIRTSLSLPALTGIGGLLAIYNGRYLDSVSLPSLVTVDGIYSADAARLTALELPSLTTVVGATPSSSWGSGDVYLYRTRLSSLAIPLLAAIPGDMAITYNDSLTALDFSSLTSLGPNLYIYGNQPLPSCYPTNLLDQLLASGWTGVAEIWGNNGTGTCP